MTNETANTDTANSCPLRDKGMSLFERYLSVWVALCIVAGIGLGTFAPGIAETLDSMAIYVGEAPVVSIPIALCLFFMMYPIMVKIDFAEVLKAGKAIRPLGLTLFINWAVKPFTMYAIATFFLGTLFLGVIGPDAVDHVKMPLGVRSGRRCGVWCRDGCHGRWRENAGGPTLAKLSCRMHLTRHCSLHSHGVGVGIISRKGNDGHTLIMVAINSLAMLVLYGLLGGFLLGVGKLPGAVAGVAVVDRHIRGAAIGCRIFFKKVVDREQGQRVVSGEVSPLFHTGNDCALCS